MSENQKDPQYKLRWSEELRGKIAQLAKEHNRSINAEITTRLEESLAAQYKESDLNMVIAGFCVGLNQRYSSQLDKLNKELATEIDEKRISLLKAEIQRMEILASETESLTKNMSNRVTQ